jgi:hypothetical protein
MFSILTPDEGDYKMSFIAVVEQDLAAVDAAALAAAKDCVAYVENVAVTDLIPALESALKNAIGVLGQDAVATLLGNASTASTPSTPAPGA